MNMYFTWHYTYFTTLSKSLFYRDFLLGMPPPGTRRKTEYCTPLLVNAMLALGCHFTSWPAARANPADSATAGDHFSREAKRLLMENDEHESPRLATVQALALMSVREAGCGREAKGWVYSGMSFRMAYDLGLNVDSGLLSIDEEETDARRMTIWGCFLFDKYAPTTRTSRPVTDQAQVLVQLSWPTTSGTPVQCSCTQVRRISCGGLRNLVTLLRRGCWSSSLTSSSNTNGSNPYLVVVRDQWGPPGLLLSSHQP